MQGFNAQLVVDDAHQIIVACDFTNQLPDVEHLPAMIDQVKTSCGDRTETMTADARYWSERNVRHCDERGIDAHISIRRDRRGGEQAGGRPKTAAMEKMRAKLDSPSGKALYARRLYLGARRGRASGTKAIASTCSNRASQADGAAIRWYPVLSKRHVALNA